MVVLDPAPLLVRPKSRSSTSTLLLVRFPGEPGISPIRESLGPLASNTSTPPTLVTKTRPSDWSSQIIKISLAADPRRVRDMVGERCLAVSCHQVGQKE